MVLPECLWILYAGAIFNTRKGFKDLFGTDWESRERAGSRAIEMAFGWRYRGLMGAVLHIDDGKGNMIHDDG